MPSLSAVNSRFTTRFEIVDGGSGFFDAIINEPGQGEMPSYQFNLPRRLLRVEAGVPIDAGIVVRDPEGSTFMLGKHGSSESRGGTLFRSFRMFEATGQFRWEKREKVIDTITMLPKDTGLLPQVPLWGCYEPSPEVFDRAVRMNFETGRFITNRKVDRDDMIDGRKVTRIDEQLGLYIVTLG